MNNQSVLLDVFFLALGAGSALWAYLAFSPMTRDMVAFLSRDAQISIYRRRRIYWAVSIACFTYLLFRLSLSLLADDPLSAAERALIVAFVAAAVIIGLLYWAMYVPVVMAPPRKHFLVMPSEADRFLTPDSVVLGVELKGTVRAYPRDLIARPHWFNDEIDGTPVMISYCILCNSAQAFVPILRDGTRLDLRNMTAFDNNTIYYCVRTGNFIQQLDGRVVQGPNKGETLESFPVIMARWEQWKELHPETMVYYAPPITLRDRVVQKLLMTMIPLSRLAARDKPWHVVRKPIDNRLPAMSFVFGVEIRGDYCAYPVAEMERAHVVNDEVGGCPIVVLFDEQRGIGEVFHRKIGNDVLTFEPASGDRRDMEVARDLETGSVWNVNGHALAGPLQGRSLAPAPHWNQLFWFSWAAFKEGTRVFRAAPYLGHRRSRRHDRIQGAT